MLIKINKKWLCACVVSLGMAVSQVNASGIPVVDGAAIAQMVKEAIETAKHYSAVISNWKKNFQEMIRGKLGNLQDATFKANDPYTQDEYLTLLTKLQKRCNKISNPDSQKLCINMINIDKEKVKLFYSSMQDIDKATAELNTAIQQQRAQSNSGKAQTAENEVQIKLDNLKRLMDQYELQLKKLDADQDFMRKARTDIAREQMLGSSTIASSLTKAAVVTYIDTKTKSIQSDASTLRTRNTEISNFEFDKHSKHKK